MVTSQSRNDEVGTYGSEKIMFEIIRERAGDGPYRVIYYTELDEKHRDTEIERAMAGEHVYDGFLRKSSIEEAKIEINTTLARLNNGETLGEAQLDKLFAPYVAL